EPAEHRLALGHASGRIEKAHHRVGGDRFAGTGLADKRERLALADREADTLERLHHARTGAEFDREVLDRERGRGGHVRLRGSTMSRTPSPSRLKQNTATIRATPGKSAIHHSPDTMKAAPSATMMPHSAVGGPTPSPMNDRPAALRIAHPMVSDICTTRIGNTLGST